MAPLMVHSSPMRRSPLPVFSIETLSLAAPPPWEKIVKVLVLPLVVMLLSAWAHTEMVQSPAIGTAGRRVSM